jgi:hypothetical protein
MHRSHFCGFFVMAALAFAQGAYGQTRPAEAAPTGRLIEGFEKLSGLRVQDGKLTAVNAGEAVTEGAQAAQLPAGATLTITIPGNQLADNGWLRIDTFPTQPLPHSLRVAFTLQGRSNDMPAYVQPGRDTLDIPLSVVAQSWPDAPVTLSIRNTGGAAIILDNIRVEPPAKAPENAVLLDCGPDNQSVWPGFTAAGAVHEALVWSARQQIYARSAPLPDPLTGDYVGPWPTNSSGDSLTIKPTVKQPATAYLWVTHYGWDHSQAPDCWIKVDGKQVYGRTTDLRAALGAKGMLEGIDGDWTPQWFDATYSAQFFDLVKFPVPPDGVRLELNNCQLAAMIIAPNAAKPAPADFVANLQKELSRYRRQFVVASRQEDICELAPTEAETRAGLMVLLPEANEAFAPGWKPQEKHRAATVTVTVANGSMAVVPLAIVPLRKGGAVTAAPGTLTTTGGRTMATAQGAVEASFLTRLPRVQGAQVQMVPWLLSKRGEAKERQIAHAALVVAPTPTTPAGLYRGPLRIQIGPDRLEVPLEIEVYDAGAPETRDTTWGAGEETHAWNLYPTLAEVMKDPQRSAFTTSIRTALAQMGGLNAFAVRGPQFSRRTFDMYPGAMIDSLKQLPAAELRGRSIIDARAGIDDLEAISRSISPMALLNDMVAKARSSAQQARVANWCLLMTSGDEAALSRDSRFIAAAVSGGAKVAVQTGAQNLMTMSQQNYTKLIRPATTLLMPPGAKTTEAISAFKKLSNDREVYLIAPADRYVAGFYTAAVGADGCYVQRLFSTPSAYNGFYFSGQGLVVPQADGTMAPTLKALQLRQAKADYELLRRGQALVEKARKLKIDPAELQAVITEIDAHAAKQDNIHFGGWSVSSMAASPQQLETWRTALCRAAGALQEAMKKPQSASRPAASP